MCVVLCLRVCHVVHNFGWGEILVNCLKGSMVVSKMARYVLVQKLIEILEDWKHHITH